MTLTWPLKNHQVRLTGIVMQHRSTNILLQRNKLGAKGSIKKYWSTNQDGQDTGTEFSYMSFELEKER
jgi:hypothetical protein